MTRSRRGAAPDIDAAVKAARAAYDGPWGAMTATDRGRLLMKMSGLIASRAEELAEAEARDTGKPIGQARADITLAARYFEYYGGAADKLHGQIVPFMNGFHAQVTREPYGVVACILPWNYPAQMFGRSLAPALAAGNAVVLKPAEDACMSPLLFSAIAEEAGIPAGAINVVTGLGHEAGAALISHDGIDMITFTGSPEVGTIVQKAAAEHHVKCTLELGGKSPQIVFADADRKKAIPTIARAITQNGGQTCSAGSRLLVERKIYDDFVGEVAEAFSNVRVGSPAMNLDLGPMISAKQRDRVNGFVDDGAQVGHSGDRGGQARQRPSERGLLCDADAVRPRAARQHAGARRSVWTRPVRAALRGRGGRDQARQRDRLWSGRGGLDARRIAPDPRRQGCPQRPGLHQLLWRRAGAWSCPSAA